LLFCSTAFLESFCAHLSRMAHADNRLRRWLVGEGEGSFVVEGRL
jgi:hypothetical protein